MQTFSTAAFLLAGDQKPWSAARMVTEDSLMVDRWINSVQGAQVAHKNGAGFSDRERGGGINLL